MEPARMYHPSDQEMPYPEPDEERPIGGLGVTRISKVGNHELKIMKALSKWLECDPDEESIRHRIFKDTECGAGIAFYQDGVTVSGYCEGSDADLPPHELLWPFTKKALFAALDECDQEASAEWNQTHGCDTCIKHWQEIMRQ